MNGTSNDEAQKTTVIKSLAIIGFVVALIFVAWLAVQAVRLVPAAFSTLASIADGLRNNTTQSEFTIATGTNIINTGETLTISWTTSDENGEYVFSYKCTDGVVAQMQNSTGSLVVIGCDTEVPLPHNGNSVAITFSSEKKRFADVSYTIGLVTDKENPVYENGLITVVNPAISTGASNIGGNVSTTTPSTSATTTPSTPVVPPAPAPSPAATSTQPTTTYTTVPTVVTTIPVSNPNGYTDLAVTFIGVGTYNTSTKVFTATPLQRNERGALRFEVKNIGTKTSGVWYFSASLPTDPAFTYNSTANVALKPNERQVITLQFENTSADRNGRITVVVTSGDDKIVSNNSLSREVSISN